MREQKRIKVAAQASGDKVLVKKCNERIKAYQAKYEQISEVTGIRTDPSRTTIPREPRKINDVLTTKNSGGIMMYRKTTNAGAFSVLPERMSKKHIRAIAKECGISLKGVKLNILFDEDLLRLNITGRADHEEIGGITLFPNAFRSKELLVRTIYHEIQHINQFKKHSAKFVMENKELFEIEAYSLEEEFIKKLKEKGVL